MRTKDISKEFKEMKSNQFDDFLFDLTQDTKDKILFIIHTDDITQAKRLKAIKEDTSYENCKFEIDIAATIEDYKKELNIFASGIKWIEKK